MPILDLEHSTILSATLCGGAVPETLTRALAALEETGDREVGILAAERIDSMANLRSFLQNAAARVMLLARVDNMPPVVVCVNAAQTTQSLWLSHLAIESPTEDARTAVERLRPARSVAIHLTPLAER
jgi:hypothetical protein